MRRSFSLLCSVAVQPATGMGTHACARIKLGVVPSLLDPHRGAHAAERGYYQRRSCAQLDYLEYTRSVRHPRAAPVRPPSLAAQVAAFAASTAPLRRFRTAGYRAAHDRGGLAGLRAAQPSDIRAVCAALRTVVEWQLEEEETAWMARMEASAEARGVGLVKKKEHGRGGGAGRKGRRGGRGPGAAAGGGTGKARRAAGAPEAESSGTSQTTRSNEPESSLESLLADEVRTQPPLL